MSAVITPTAVQTTPGPDPEARDQEVIVRYLAERTRSQLAGDAAEMKRIVERRPSQLLQLGVLPPLPPDDPDSGRTGEQIAREFNRPPSHIGLIFEIGPDDQSTEVELAFEAAFLFYIQRYPERSEQQNRHGAAGGQTSLIDVYERHELESGRVSVKLDLTKSSGRALVPLDTQVQAGLGAVLADAKTVYPFSAAGHRIPAAALDNDGDYWKAIKEAEHPDVRAKTPHTPPKVAVEFDWRRTAAGHVRIQVALRNNTQEPVRTGASRKKTDLPTMYRELHLFNSRLRVYEQGEPIVATSFREMPKSFRYDKLRTVEATGINCVGRRARPEEDPDLPLVTDTWPLHRQRRVVQNDDPAVRMTFDELRGDGALAALGRIQSAMEDYEALWRNELKNWGNPATYKEAEEAFEAFQNDDLRLFKRGMRCLRDDKKLLAAFKGANEVFYRIDNAKPPHKRFEIWRLFQLVFQVCQLGALRVREAHAEADLRAELDVCDVLWFPTGGGKTEAYLGLIVMALLYDRLRGKKRGTTALLRFPLRMLSVQQLQRILDVLWVVERYRLEQVAQDVIVDGGDYTGDELLLGYWVGRDNTPNSLVDTRADLHRDNIRWWADLIKAGEADDERIVTLCPNPACKGGKVELEADVAGARLNHVCRTCKERLPIVITDDEVYRYLPGVLIATVDKFAHLARADELAGMFAGPLYRCPKHGYFNSHQLVWGRGGGPPEADDRCLAAQFCDIDVGDYELVGDTYDPAPALQIQDELHLLEEELGSLDAHYETLFELLGTDLGSGLPTKLLAASATVEAVEEQVRHLYARNSRVFPSQGWELGESFYVHTTDDARRLYFGALPYRTHPQEFGARIQTMLHAEVIRMQTDPMPALARLQQYGLDQGRDADWLQEQLQFYELSLGYVNRKPDAEHIGTRLARERFAPTQEQVQVETLIADYTSPARISAVLNRIEQQYDDGTSREDRLRALVATSIISHGVDLNALNLMVMNGMTPSVAGYVQASSRSGRTHVGLIIVGFDRRKARERSFFQYFLKYHDFLDRLITPVPVNRFAKFSVHWTLPGVLSALLGIAYQRERVNQRGPNPNKPQKTLLNGGELIAWLGSGEQPANKEQHLLARALRGIGIGKQVHDASGNSTPLFDPIWEGSLREAAEREFANQMVRQQMPGGKSSTPERFYPKPLPAFRSVEEPLSFGAVPDSGVIETALTTGPWQSTTQKKGKN